MADRSTRCTTLGYNARRMNPGRQLILIWSGAIALYAAALAMVAAAWWLPLAQPVLNVAPTPPATRPATQPADDLSLDTFESASRHDLRQPLYPRAIGLPLVPGVAAVQRQESGVRLVGTVQSGGLTRGLFMTSGGRVELRGPGEQVGQAKVVRVDPKAAQVNVGGGVVSLSLERVPVAPAQASSVAQPARVAPPAQGPPLVPKPLVIPPHIMPKELLEKGS